MIKRAWDVQIKRQPWFSLGFLFDHTDPSLSIYLSFFIISVGRLKQPGYAEIQGRHGEFPWP